MKTNQSRMTSLILAMLLLASGCSSGTETRTPGTDAPETAPAVQEETQPAETVPEETEPEYEPLPQESMDGFEFRFFNYDDSYLTWSINILTADDITGEPLNDEVFERNNRVMSQYNCVISEKLDRDPTMSLGNLVKSGDAGAEVVMLYDVRLVDNYLGGNLQTWEVLPYVDFEAPYWSWDATQTFSAGGKVYAATGDFSLGQNTRSFILLFNKDMYANLGLTENLYELASAGKWTMDKMLAASDAAVADLDGNGEMNLDDRYGAAGALKLYFGSLVTGAGVKYIDLDETGSPYFAIPGNEYAITVMTDIMNKHSGNNRFKQVVAGVHNGSNESKAMFINNQLLFQGTAMKSVANFRDMESDIGILPFPKYSEEQERYYALTSGGAIAGLPITLKPENYKNVGIILEALCRDSHDSLIPLYKETLLKSKYARDEGSAAMLDIIFQSAVYDIGISVLPDNTYIAYMEIFESGTDTFASKTKSSQKMVKKLLEKLAAAGEEKTEES